MKWCNCVIAWYSLMCCSLPDHKDGIGDAGGADDQLFASAGIELAAYADKPDQLLTKLRSYRERMLDEMKDMQARRASLYSSQKVVTSPDDVDDLIQLLNFN